MRLYLDTSALIPLIMSEPASPACRSLWSQAETVVSSALTHVEATATLARAVRGGRLQVSEHRSALTALDDAWSRVAVVPADRPRLTVAARLATAHALRGYDAVHCASAVLLVDGDLTAASGDQELLAAWRAEGLAIVDTTR